MRARPSASSRLHRLLARMKQIGLIAAGMVLLTGAQAPPGPDDQMAAEPLDWSRRQATELLISAQDMAQAGVDPDAIDSAPLRRALADKDPAAIDTAARDLFFALARGQAQGFAPEEARARWAIPDDPLEADDLQLITAEALAAGDVTTALGWFEPTHPQYSALKAQWARTPETETATRQQLALNMDRWRWMPQDLGEDYILVNIPAFEIHVIRKGITRYRGRVIVGKTSTRTPIFATTATGVILNPTWYVPKSIVRESVGALLANHPEIARQRGYYVASDGNVRQKPGPGNALGQMKLAMPNSYSVYIHDTPSKELFGRNVRALSHGCIRADKALDLAKVLLEPVWPADAVTGTVTSRQTAELDFATPMPVYIAYFTAYADDDGTVRHYPDIYGYDAQALRLMNAGVPAGPKTALAPPRAEAPLGGCATLDL